MGVRMNSKRLKTPVIQRVFLNPGNSIRIDPGSSTEEKTCPMLETARANVGGQGLARIFTEELKTYVV